MAGMGLGRVKTQTCFWKVEFPSRNRSPESWRHSQHSSRGRDRENNSQQLLPRHVFTQPGSISTIDDVRWVSGAPSIAPKWRTTASRRRSAANGGDKVAGPTTETSGRLTVETALPFQALFIAATERSIADHSPAISVLQLGSGSSSPALAPMASVPKNAVRWLIWPDPYRHR
jgi:hypothetical protein